MKKLFIVANWKANLTNVEAKKWMTEVLHTLFVEAGGTPDTENNLSDKEIIVCPPSIHLSDLETIRMSAKPPFKLTLGVQDVSQFDSGAYTGEEPAGLLKEFADYAIIGHSERRTYFSENKEILFQKVEKAFASNITPIFCVQGIETPIPENVSIVAYEPVEAIGTGHPDTPEDAESVAKTIKEKHKVQYVLYGGSVTPENVQTFTQVDHIDGILVGGASLDPKSFIQIVENS